MSEAKVRWAVKRNDRNGMVTWATTETGGVFSSSGDSRRLFATRHEAFQCASRATSTPCYGDDVRIVKVKLTRRAKGWRPASEPPPPMKEVLGVVDDLQRVVRWSSLDGWRFALNGTRTTCVTHWRELPRGPK